MCRRSQILILESAFIFFQFLSYLCTSGIPPMYTKTSLFPRATKSGLSLTNECRSSSATVKRIDTFLRNLTTAVKRWDVRNPSRCPTDDDSLHYTGNINDNGGIDFREFQQRVRSRQNLNPRAGFKEHRENNTPNPDCIRKSYTDSDSVSSRQEIGWNFRPFYSEGARNLNGYNQNLTGGCQEVSESFRRSQQVQESSTSYHSNESRHSNNSIHTGYSWSSQTQSSDGLPWQNSTTFYSQVQSHSEGNLNSNSYYQQNGGSPWQSGNNSDGNIVESQIDVKIKEFDTFCKEGMIKEALHAIDSLASMGSIVDLARLLGLAQICGEAEAVQEAKAVYEKINGLVSHLDVNSSHVIIEMYFNCGLVADGLSVFEKMPEKNLKTWHTIIRCFAKNDLGEDAIEMFTRFKKEGNKPDGELFKEVFFTCGVLGDINEGLLHFESMSKDYGIIPSIEQYVSIVEMLALPGFLDEALNFIEKIPVEPNADVWETLMYFSRVHGDLELGDRCAELVEELDPTRLSKQAREGFVPVKESDIMRESLKKRSKSHDRLAITNRAYEFKAGDNCLPENDELHELLCKLKSHMVAMGYVPDTRSVLHDIDQESKETALLGHSERTAFARGVLNSPARRSIRIIKNLRVCVDCHNALKIMSSIVGREFIIRDAKRFHLFKDGDCSCKNYW